MKIQLLEKKEIERDTGIERKRRIRTKKNIYLHFSKVYVCFK